MSTETLPEPTVYPYTTETEARLRVAEMKIEAMHQAIQALFDTSQSLAVKVEFLLDRLQKGGVGFEKSVEVPS